MSIVATIFFVLVALVFLAMIDPLVGLAFVRAIDALDRRWKKR